MLEEAIKENTAAIRELIALYKPDRIANAAATAAIANAAAPDPAPASEPKARTRTKAAAPDATGAKAPDAPAPDPAEKPAAVTYEQAAKAVTSLIQRKGKDAAIGVLKTFDASKLPEVKPAQFADVVAACEALA